MKGFILLAVGLIATPSLAQESTQRPEGYRGHVGAVTVGLEQNTAETTSGDATLGGHASGYLIENAQTGEPMLLVGEVDLDVSMLHVSEEAVLGGFQGIQGGFEVLFGGSGPVYETGECTGYGGFSMGADFSATPLNGDRDRASGHAGAEAGSICRLGHAVFLMTGAEVGAIDSTDSETRSSLGLIARVRIDNTLMASLAARTPLGEDGAIRGGGTQGEIQLSVDGRLPDSPAYLGMDVRVSDLDEIATPDGTLEEVAEISTGAYVGWAF